MPPAELETYLDLNSRYENPFVFGLTSRGFFSEVNNLLNAVLYCLVAKRRLVVDQRHFGAGAWEEIFESELPERRQSDLGLEFYSGQRRQEQARKALILVRNTIGEWWENKTPIVVPELAIGGGMFEAKRQLAAMLCTPLQEGAGIAGSPPTGEYAACHVRRGDKVLGWVTRAGTRIAEGEDTPCGAYLAEIRRTAPGLSQIFVMTDDMRLVDDFRAAAEAGTTVHSLGDPSQQGYFQKQFNSKSKEDRREDIRQLLREVAVAAASKVFVGAYLSNVSRFVPLIHRAPEACFSADSQKAWHPR